MLGLLAGGLLMLALLLTDAGVALAQGDAGMAGGDGDTTSTADGGQAAFGMMGGGAGIMGSGGMMGGDGSAVTASTPQAARTLAQQLAGDASIDRQTNTVTYDTADVELVALGSPEGQQDMTWNVDGLVNPTIVVPEDAQVTVHFFDADTGTPHGWELTTAPPPYPFMVMMDAPAAFSGAFAMPAPGATDSQWFGRTVRFTAADAGAYYYLCPAPGHAQQGMDGKLVVR